ncbi:hypothetical protein GMRT_11256 [Giardia muris]|uniref:Uncharacterized protein n=1 Tax=Giardia muris TaxID=5742 RepID=A0A4Z1T5D4_GIAMU|nr:hypothetical protein GMRT_11256 [Giardia muris]|eukprot:TNJ28317.1 hypothetical protein GMRT_11256 [Giardia muris]
MDLNRDEPGLLPIIRGPVCAPHASCTVASPRDIIPELVGDLHKDENVFEMGSANDIYSAIRWPSITRDDLSLISTTRYQCQEDTQPFLMDRNLSLTAGLPEAQAGLIHAQLTHSLGNLDAFLGILEALCSSESGLDNLLSWFSSPSCSHEDVLTVLDSVASRKTPLLPYQQLLLYGIELGLRSDMDIRPIFISARYELELHTKRETAAARYSREEEEEGQTAKRVDDQYSVSAMLKNRFVCQKLLDYLWGGCTNPVLGSFSLSTVGPNLYTFHKPTFDNSLAIFQVSRGAPNGVLADPLFKPIHSYRGLVPIDPEQATGNWTTDLGTSRDAISDWNLYAFTGRILLVEHVEPFSMTVQLPGMAHRLSIFHNCRSREDAIQYCKKRYYSGNISYFFPLAQDLAPPNPPFSTESIPSHDFHFMPSNTAMEESTDIPFVDSDSTGESSFYGHTDFFMPVTDSQQIQPHERQPLCPDDDEEYDADADANYDSLNDPFAYQPSTSTTSSLSTDSFQGFHPQAKAEVWDEPRLAFCTPPISVANLLHVNDVLFIHPCTQAGIDLQTAVPMLVSSFGHTPCCFYGQRNRFLLVKDRTNLIKSSTLSPTEPVLTTPTPNQSGPLRSDEVRDPMTTPTPALTMKRSLAKKEPEHVLQVTRWVLREIPTVALAGQFMPLPNCWMRAADTHYDEDTGKKFHDPEVYHKSKPRDEEITSEKVLSIPQTVGQRNLLNYVLRRTNLFISEVLRNAPPETYTPADFTDAFCDIFKLIDIERHLITLLKGYRAVTRVGCLQYQNQSSIPTISPRDPVDMLLYENYISTGGFCGEFLRRARSNWFLVAALKQSDPASLFLLDRFNGWYRMVTSYFTNTKLSMLHILRDRPFWNQYTFCDAGVFRSFGTSHLRYGADLSNVQALAPRTDGDLIFGSKLHELPFSLEQTTSIEVLLGGLYDVLTSPIERNIIFNPMDFVNNSDIPEVGFAMRPIRPDQLREVGGQVQKLELPDLSALSSLEPQPAISREFSLSVHKARQSVAAKGAVKFLTELGLSLPELQFFLIAPNVFSTIPRSYFSVIERGVPSWFTALCLANGVTLSSRSMRKTVAAQILQDVEKGPQYVAEVWNEVVAKYSRPAASIPEELWTSFHTLLHPINVFEVLPNPPLEEDDFDSESQNGEQLPRSLTFSQLYEFPDLIFDPFEEPMLEPVEQPKMHKKKVVIKKYRRVRKKTPTEPIEETPKKVTRETKTTKSAPAATKKKSKTKTEATKEPITEPEENPKRGRKKTKKQEEPKEVEPARKRAPKTQKDEPKNSQATQNEAPTVSRPVNSYSLKQGTIEQYAETVIRLIQESGLIERFSASQKAAIAAFAADNFMVKRCNKAELHEIHGRIQRNFLEGGALPIYGSQTCPFLSTQAFKRSAAVAKVLQRYMGSYHRPLQTGNDYQAPHQYLLCSFNNLYYPISTLLQYAPRALREGRGPLTHGATHAISGHLSILVSAGAQDELHQDMLEQIVYPFHQLQGTTVPPQPIPNVAIETRLTKMETMWSERHQSLLGALGMRFKRIDNDMGTAAIGVLPSSLEERAIFQTRLLSVHGFIFRLGKALDKPEYVSKTAIVGALAKFRMDSRVKYAICRDWWLEQRLLISCRQIFVELRQPQDACMGLRVLLPVGLSTGYYTNVTSGSPLHISPMSLSHEPFSNYVLGNANLNIANSIKSNSARIMHSSYMAVGTKGNVDGRERFRLDLVTSVRAQYADFRYYPGATLKRLSFSPSIAMRTGLGTANNISWTRTGRRVYRAPTLQKCPPTIRAAVETIRNYSVMQYASDLEHAYLQQLATSITRVGKQRYDLSKLSRLNPTQIVEGGAVGGHGVGDDVYGKIPHIRVQHCGLEVYNIHHEVARVILHKLILMSEEYKRHSTGFTGLFVFPDKLLVDMIQKSPDTSPLYGLSVDNPRFYMTLFDPATKVEQVQALVADLPYCGFQLSTDICSVLHHSDDWEVFGYDLLFQFLEMLTTATTTSPFYTVSGYLAKESSVHIRNLTQYNGLVESPIFLTTLETRLNHLLLKQVNAFIAFLEMIQGILQLVRNSVAYHFPYTQGQEANPINIFMQSFLHPDNCMLPETIQTAEALLRAVTDNPRIQSSSFRGITILMDATKKFFNRYRYLFLLLLLGKVVTDSFSLMRNTSIQAEQISALAMEIIWQLRMFYFEAYQVALSEDYVASALAWRRQRVRAYLIQQGMLRE